MENTSTGNGQAALTREQFLAAAAATAVKRVPLHVPELGGKIYVKGMSGKERDRVEERFRIKQGNRTGQSDFRNFRAYMVCQVVVNEAGERLLNDGDIEMVGALQSGVLDRIISKSTELSGAADDEPTS